MAASDTAGYDHVLPARAIATIRNALDLLLFSDYGTFTDDAQRALDALDWLEDAYRAGALRP